MAMSNTPGNSPGPMRETQAADGCTEQTAADMSAVCDAAVEAATSHRESEGRKVEMGL
jgi:hypothetical protein